MESRELLGLRRRMLTLQHTAGRQLPCTADCRHPRLPQAYAGGAGLAPQVDGGTVSRGPPAALQSLFPPIPAPAMQNAPPLLATHQILPLHRSSDSLGSSGGLLGGQVGGSGITPRTPARIGSQPSSGASDGGGAGAADEDYFPAVSVPCMALLQSCYTYKCCSLLFMWFRGVVTHVSAVPLAATL